MVNPTRLFEHVQYFHMIRMQATHSIIPALAACALLSLSAALSAESPPTVVFFGDSLTAGYGLDPNDGYPAIIQQKINANDWPFEVVASAVSGETSAGGLRRINWQLQRPVDVFVLALGANDGLRGLPPEQLENNLQGILDRVRQAYPKADLIVAGMHMPPNMGAEYRLEFDRVYPRLAKLNNAGLIPFLLDGVAGDPLLNLADAIHPNADGQKIVAANVWQILAPVLENRLNNPPQ